MTHRQYRLIIATLLLTLWPLDASAQFASGGAWQGYAGLLGSSNPWTARQYFDAGFDVRYSSVLFDRLSVNSSGNLLFQATEKAPGAATAALAGLGAGNVNSGTHSYKVTFVTAGGETDAGAVSGTVTTTAGDGQVSLSAIPTGSTFVTSRKVYRTAAGNAVTGPWLLLATIADNTTTTYADNIADASLTTAIPSVNTAIDTRWTFKNSGVFDTANTAPSFTLTDTTASAKSLTLAVDANLAQLRESAGASGSLMVLDLANNWVGVKRTPVALALEIQTHLNDSTGMFLAGYDALGTKRIEFGATAGGQAGMYFAGNTNLKVAFLGNIITYSTFDHHVFKTYNGSAYAEALRITGNGAAATLNVSAPILPNANGTYDLGSSTLGFKRLYVDYTNTATIGAVTIDKASFRANIALGATSVVVTNSYVTAASKVLCVAAQNDTTGRVTATVPGAGTVTIHSIATTADMAVDCVVVNAN